MALEESQATPTRCAAPGCRRSPSTRPMRRASCRPPARMADNKHWDRALAFCRQAALLEPGTSQPYADALAYAELHKDSAGDGVGGQASCSARIGPSTTAGCTSRPRPRLQTLATTLDKEQRQTESERLRAALRKLKQRDLVVTLTWEAAASPASSSSTSRNRAAPPARCSRRRRRAAASWSPSDLTRDEQGQPTWPPRPSPATTRSTCAAVGPTAGRPCSPGGDPAPGHRS